MYAIAFGNRLFGKVDKVRGKYHVATLCWHFCYLPLVPLGTYLVLSESASGLATQFRGIRIPFSAKSLLMAWTRSMLTVPFWIAAVSLVVIPMAVEHVDYTGYFYLAGFEVLVILLLFGPYFIPGVGLATAGRAKGLARLTAARQGAVGKRAG